MLSAAILSQTAPRARGAYTPPVSTLKIGLYYGDTALTSANLQNAAGYGSGYDFGYYDNNRDFVPLGAWTGEERITMVMDRNMAWHPGTENNAGEYREAEPGETVTVGAYHIQLDTTLAP